MKIKKIVALSALILVAALIFGGCVKNDSPVVMSYGDSVITADMYSYWMSTYKGFYLYSYEDVEDTEEYWQTEVGENVTADELMTGMIKENVQMTLVCMKLFEDLGLEFPKEYSENLDNYLNDLIDANADGNKSLFNMALSEYGVNDKVLRDIFTEEQKTTLLYNHMYGEGGTETVTDEQRDEFFRSGAYSRVHQIFINNKYVYEFDEEGNYVYDDDGNIVRSELEGEELEKKNAAVAAVDQGIESGSDFDALYEQYSEEKSYPGGYYIHAEMDFISEVVVKALSMKPGETAKVETDYGTHFLKCMELEDKAWENEANADFFDDFEDQVTNYLFRNFVKSHIDEIVVNEEEIGKYKISAATPNYSFS